MSRHIFAVGALLCLSFVVLRAQNQPPVAGGLNLVVVQGNGFVNNIKARTMRPTIVQVEDDNHRPIAGVAVTFVLPADGPGGAFTNGGTSLIQTTGPNGQATMTFQPNQVTGQVNIRVTASSQGRQASTTITQTNVRGGGFTGRNHLLRNVGIVGAAVATVGICRAAQCGGWGSSSSNNVQIIKVTPN